MSTPQSTLSKRTRVVATILGISGVATVMVLVLAGVSRRSGGGATSVTVSQAAAHALAATTVTSRSSVAAAATATPRRLHRILAYGDSLTAGSSGSEVFPYAVYLEQALRVKQPSGAEKVTVRHRGLPGWTVVRMLEDLDGRTTGLRSAIQAVKDPPLSLVILLAGTNDLGHGYTAQEITDNLIALHNVCMENGVPRTIAIGIPPSGYQSRNAAAAALAATVNGNLQTFAAQTKPSHTVTYMPFPFDFEQNGENWFSDTLHFSKRGYQVLGESLAPVVEQILQNLDEQHQESAV